MKKSQNMLGWLSKMVFGPTFLHNLLRLVKGTAKSNPCQKKRVINMI
jgi:hypothetical protein